MNSWLFDSCGPSVSANMKTKYALLLIVFCLLQEPPASHAEKWIEFHAESWTHQSKKHKRKLHFSTHSYIDTDSISRTATGDVTVWIRDISRNDRFYVRKGDPASEVVYKQILMRCKAQKYEVMLDEGAETDGQESIGEDIKSGSIYDKLYRKLCAESTAD